MRKVKWGVIGCGGIADRRMIPGTVTYTPSGSGHGIKNTGSDMLTFIALIILD